MNVRDLHASRLLILIGVAIVLFGQAGSSFYLRYLRCQNKAYEFTSAESSYRAKAGTHEEVATNLRQVASLAREMAGSSTSDFERSKWLEMARTEERKANRSDEQAVQLMTRADYFSTQAIEHSKLAWRPWLPAPE